MKSTNHYKESWEIYKAESQHFKDDFSYYQTLCSNKDVLELFAGYGRLANTLQKTTHSIECVELDSNFASSIEIPQKNIHVCNVLNFKTEKKYDCVIAGYNSFCLITQEEEVLKFFKLIHQWLKPNGFASLSYYDHRKWENTPSSKFIFNDMKVKYIPDCDLSALDQGKAIWIDTYQNKENNFFLSHKYPLKIYTESTLKKYLELANLKLVDVIYDYGKKNLEDPGWIEYVIQKNI